MEETQAKSIPTYGDRLQVIRGLAKKTRGGLSAEDLVEHGDKILTKREFERVKVPASDIHCVEAVDGHGPVERQPTDETQKIKKVGTKEEVYHNLAVRTSGHLTKDMLALNSKGFVVSKKMQEAAKLRMDNALASIKANKKADS